LKVLLRNMQEGDQNFVFATYLRNRWFDKTNKTTLKRSTWSAIQHKRLEKVFASKRVVMACLDEDSDTLLGYGFVDQDGPYIYVKLPYRAGGLGIKDRITKELLNGSD
jgi:hypothetical protein